VNQMVKTAQSRWAKVATAAILALPLALLGPARGQAQTPSPSKETVSLAVGASTTIALGENPSTGYAWRVDTAQSTNLGIVRVIDRGYRAGKSGLLGAPGSHRWQISAQAPGTARVVFAYSRPWEQAAPAETKTVDVTVTANR
jgi:inhibitor of cysteine peptidase